MTPVLGAREGIALPVRLADSGVKLNLSRKRDVVDSLLVSSLCFKGDEENVFIPFGEDDSGTCTSLSFESLILGYTKQVLN